MGGLFDAIRAFLGSTLSFFYDLTPSFGFAIILLTVAINIVLFPLTLKQTRATRAFQQIQPEIKRIQKEHKDDPEKLQQELMRTQREAGATPGGCLLPILVQFPIWISLFQVLRNIANVASGVAETTQDLPEGSALLDAVRAGDTRFLGMDLGTNMSEGVTGGMPGAIPYVIMLVLMVAAQYIQQWHAMRGQIRRELSGQAKQQQQTQQALTRIMPLFIGFISWSFPAGLVVYWTTSNIFRLGQQFLIFAIDGRPSPPPDVSDAAGGSPATPGPEGESPKPKKPQPVSQKKRRRRRK